jgi:hypothetical protein
MIRRFIEFISTLEERERERKRFMIMKIFEMIIDKKEIIN